MTPLHQYALSLAYIAPALAIIPFESEFALLTIRPGERNIIASGGMSEILEAATRLFTEAQTRHEATLAAEAARAADFSFTSDQLDLSDFTL